MSRFFAATASPASSPRSPELSFFARSRVVAGATCVLLCLGVGPPTLCAFRLREPRYCHEIWCPMSPGGAAQELPVPSPPSIRPATTSRPRCRTKRRFPPSQDVLRRVRVRYAPVVTQDTFEWSELLALCRRFTALHATCSVERHAVGTPFSPITAARSVTSFTGPPRRADSSPSPHAVHRSRERRCARGEIREDASRQSLQPTLLSNTGTLRAYRLSSSGLTPEWPPLLAPSTKSAHQYGSRSATMGGGAGSQPTFADSYPGLESRSGWLPPPRAVA
jgi:hypothetical protein